MAKNPFKNMPVRDTTEFYVLTIELQQKTEEGRWDKRIPSQWMVETFEELEEAKAKYDEFHDHWNTRQIFLSVPLMSMDTVCLDKWASPAVKNFCKPFGEKKRG